MTERFVILTNGDWKDPCWDVEYDREGALDERNRRNERAQKEGRSDRHTFRKARPGEVQEILGNEAAEAQAEAADLAFAESGGGREAELDWQHNRVYGE